MTVVIAVDNVLLFLTVLSPKDVVKVTWVI